MSGLRIRIAGWALIGLSSLLSGVYLTTHGAAALSWDDSEYISQALLTHDRVKDAGIWTWPLVIAREQHYAKPPLLVNTLALAALVLGRTHVWGAVGVVLALSNLALLWGVARLFRSTMDERAALLAVLTTAGLPVMVAFAPMVLVEVQLAALVVWMMALLVSSREGPPPGWRWTIALGVVLGLGMLSKATFPFYAILPLGLWLWEGRRQAAARFDALGRAVVIGALIALVWYWGNWAEALFYARLAAVVVMDPSVTAADRLAQWLKFVARDGVGWTVALAMVLGWVRWSRADWRLPAWLTASAVPLILTAVLSPAPVTTRHLLVSELELGLAGCALVAAALASGRIALWRRAAIFAVLGLGAALGMGAHALMASDACWNQPRVQAARERWLPALVNTDSNSELAVEAAFQLLAAANEQESALLVGEDLYMNVPRLALHSVTQANFIRFDYATYFNWTEARCVARLAAAREARQPILVYRRPWSAGEPAYLNRYEGMSLAYLADPANGYREVGRRAVLGAELALYTRRPSEARPEIALREARAMFGGQIELLGVGFTEREFAVRLRVARHCAVNYKLMAHIHRDGEAGAPRRIWDQTVRPPLSNWVTGQTRVLRFGLPEGFDPARDAIRIGFFDEADSAHGWPPLKRENGTPYFEARVR
jgi:MFS family permease